MSAAIRFIFGRSADGVTLISRQRVDMTLPAQHFDDNAQPHAFVAELRGADGQLLHRTALADPMESHREVFSQEPDRSIVRVPVAQPDGVFTVVVPDTPDADHLALLRAGPARNEAGSLLRALADGPREIARFPLRDPDVDGGQPK